MKFLTQLLQRLNVYKVLALIILIMIIQNSTGFRFVSLYIQSERLSKQISTEEILPSTTQLEVL